MSMPVEETLQPSFTVTAELHPLAQLAVISQNSDAASESYDSYANRPLGTTADTSDQTTTEVPDVESESLRQWTLSQQKANGSYQESTSVRSREEGVVKPVEGNEDTAEAVTDMAASAGAVDNYRESQSPGPDISAEMPFESATKGSESENVPSPINTPPPPSSTAVQPLNPSIAQNRLTPAFNPTFQPINRYSPHKAPNFAIPSPAKPRSLFGRPKKSVVEERDSFAEDDRRIPRQQPVDKLKRLLEHYDSTSTRGDGDGEVVDAFDVPGWEEEVMKPQETVGDESAGDVAEGHGQAPAGDEKHQNHAEDQHQAIHTSHHDRSPSPARSSHSNKSLSASPAPRQNGFGTLIESESSLGMPSEMHFTQDDDLALESQHSTHSIPNVATQSLQHNRPPYLSSPPPSPPRESTTQSDPRSHPSTVSTDPNNSHPSAKGTTQEATQLVTEDELITRSTGSPPTFPARRALPTARARLAGRAVISQPADRSRPYPTDALPHTIAAPPSRLLARRTPVPAPVFEDTFVDPRGDGDIEMRESSPVVEQDASSAPQSTAADIVTSPIPIPPVAAATEATYVDPTLTSLPPPPPKRPTPVKYGAKAIAAPTREISPIPTPTPGRLATPPPTAGPSKSPHISPARSPSAQPVSTKSGRIPKRKRRESSASMSASSSSSEDVDVYDESYRPAAKPTTNKGKGKATNPNLKRLKKGTRSRSGSHTTSASNSGKEAAGSTTPLTEVSDTPDRPFVLACWYPNWFIGRVRGIEQGKYDIDYEDGTHSLVAVDRVRRGILRIGDKIKSEDHKGEEFTVVEEWDGDERGVKVKGHRLALSRVYLRPAVIKADFQDRIISPQDLGFDFEPTAPSRPSMNASTKSISTTSDIFAGKIFFITSTSSASVTNKNNQRDAASLIAKHGGKFVEKWHDLLDLPTSGFGSTLTSTSAPFLIQETSQASLTPKALISLAKGIPCLSMAFIEDVIANPSVCLGLPVD
jgi:hypothetical protein